MLETIIKLLERFVVAHELIAANSARNQKYDGPLTGAGVDTKVSGGVGPDGPITKGDGGSEKSAKAKPEEDDLADDDEPEEKPKRKPRATKPKAEPEPDLDKLREEIEVMAKHIGSGDSDDCADELDDLLDEYDARSVKKLKDLQVQEFHKEIKAIDTKLLRFEISSMKAALKEAKATDALEDLLEDYKVDNEKALTDEQVAGFHKELKAIVAKYYDIEE